MAEEIYGVSLETLADIMTKDGELRAQYGEQQGRQALGQYLRERGLDENQWAHAHNAWWERFRADPTGMAEAQFHQMLSQRSMKAHFGDVRDMTGDQLEGVSLDLYAQICVAMSQPGADAEAVARQHGLAGGAAQWTAANAAWGAKMSQDTTHALTTQFGTLYQKHAGPQFAQQQLAQSAAILAASNQPRASEPTKEKDMSQATLLAELGSSDTEVRWKAARWLAHQWRKGDPATEANLACVPVLLEVLERHDEHTVSNAEDAVRKLTSDLELHTDDVKSAITRCLARAQERLSSLEAAFAPIRDKAVPERVTMQSRIQDYTSLVDTLSSTLRDWPSANTQAAAASPFSVSASPVARPKKGFPVAVLAVIPALAVGGFFVKKAMTPSPDATTTTTTAASAATPAPAASAPAAVAAPMTTAPPAPPPHVAPPATKPKKGKPGH